MADPAAPTEADRDTFRDRLKSAIGDAGTTAKALEEALGLSRGTITRIYGGRRQLDLELLTGIAGELGVAAEALVEGTSFQALLAPPVRTTDEVTETGGVAGVAVSTTDDVRTADSVQVEPELEPAPPESVDEEEPEEVEPAEEIEPDLADDVVEAAPAGAPEPEDAQADPPIERAHDEARRSETKRRRRILDVPVRAAVAIAGGLALVGGTLAALVRRK